MPSCIQTINATNRNSITQLTPSTLMPVSITGQLKQLFIFEVVRQETVKFTISLSSNNSVTNLGVTVNIYQDSPFLHLGSVLVTEMNLSFQKDLTPGTYIICIGSTQFTYSGNFIGYFTGFQIFAKLKFDFYSGQTLHSDMTVPLPDRICNKTLYYQILDGSLPPGLSMTLTGNIEGVLPNMDCIKDNDELSPSQNWYYQIEDQWLPWGRQWRFKVRVWIFNSPETFADRWFCIRVHNNWSWDKDNITPPFEYSIPEVYIPLEETLETDLCCDDEAIQEEKQYTMMSECECEKEENDEIISFLKWYFANIGNENLSEEVLQFINNFKETQFYQDMMSATGLNKTVEEEKEVILSEIKRRSNEMINGRNKDDIDYQMLEIKDDENQKLPITILAFFSQNFSISLE